MPSKKSPLKKVSKKGPKKLTSRQKARIAKALQGQYMGLLNAYRGRPNIQAKAKKLATRSYEVAIKYLRGNRGRPVGLGTTRRYASYLARVTKSEADVARSLRLRRGFGAAIAFMKRATARRGGTAKRGARKKRSG